MLRTSLSAFPIPGLTAASKLYFARPPRPPTLQRLMQRTTITLQTTTETNTPNKLCSFSTMAPKKVCILGSGNWGSTIARLVGVNAANNPEKFARQVNMWVFEEIVNGEKLSEIINTRHENVKYLPGKVLPENVVAITDVVEASKDADILIIVIPHQFIKRSLGPLQGNLKPNVEGISLVKGFGIRPEGGIELITDVIKNVLGPLRVSVLMGANLAGEVASDQFCETTIGCTDPEAGALYKLLIESPNFRVTVVTDAITVEMCGALKNIVAVGAGFVDGLKLGDNTKAAVIRIGLMEMVKYVREFGGDSPILATFFESCGVADLVTTCYGGRNRKVAEAFVLQKKSIAQLEEELLNGQKLQGPETALEVNVMLKERDLENSFPLFTAVHKICIGELEPEKFIDCLRDHPVHMAPQE